jgi:hypothetical protein
MKMRFDTKYPETGKFKAPKLVLITEHDVPDSMIREMQGRMMKRPRRARRRKRA